MIPRGLSLLFLMSLSSVLASSQRVYIGTYTRSGTSAGIYSLELDTGNGTLTTPRVAAELRDPTFLDLSPDGTVLHAGTDYGAGPDGRSVGGVNSYRVQDDGSLRLISAQPIAAPGSPCHVTSSPDGKLVVAVQYNAAWVASLPVAGDGGLKEFASLTTHEGPLGPQKDRQDKPHAHSAVFAADGRHVYVCDLGMDRIKVYAPDVATGDLVPAGEGRSAPGAGPRHSRPSADGRFLYVLNELASSVDVFALSEGGTKLECIQTLSSLPADFKGGNTCAEIRIHPNGRFVYASNRGADLLTVFARDPQSGRLTLVQHLSSGGAHPRNFTLSPDGAWLLCANRDSDNVVVFHVDPQTGRLSPNGQVAKVPQAVCVLFAR
jgi:6-phosphogluconolactonase